jgi:uncharacterized repeat protein (TIGR03803 family)
MREQTFTARIFAAALAALVMLLSSGASAGARENVIARFNLSDGAQPVTGLIADAQGNLYGTAISGGNGNCLPRGCGLVFELSPGSNGTWTKKTIYAFKGGASDTSNPGTDLIFDAKGNLFGASGFDASGFFGAVYELTPGAGGTWAEKIVYKFNNQAYDPLAHLAFDSKGNLYGAVAGTFNLNGGVFELSPQADGTWKENLIYTFSSTNGDGHRPVGGVVLDGKGNIYGMTQSGGASNYGTVYKLSPNGSGGFAETIIHNFTGQTDGAYPFAPLTIDAKGNLFGTTYWGGPVDNPFGVVFELSPSGSAWNETVLYSFGASPDGLHPSGVVFDAAGNLYGTTVNGGNGCNYPGCGIAYKLSPQGSGPWKETILHNLESAGDGSESVAGLLVEKVSGRLYGTTQYGGGRYGNGTVFEVQP